MTNSVVHLEYDDFCRRFLEYSNHASRTRRSRSNPFKILKNADNMPLDELCDVFMNVVNTHKLIPNSTMSCHQLEAAPSTDARHKINVGIFKHGSRGELKSLSWSDQTIPVVLVEPAATGADPFDVTEPDSPHDEIQDIQEKSLQRISIPVELLFAAQHRVAVLMLFVIGRKFRFARWDRAGLIVTPAVDYFENYATLCDLLFRISRLDDAALGFDLSATRILPGTAEFSQMDAAAEKHYRDVDHTERNLEAGEIEGPFVFEYARTLFRDSLDVDWPRHRLQVSSGTAARSYLVGKPVFRSDGVAGRGTRGYVALDCQTGRFVWLKDVWRMSYIHADREGDILRRLNLADIDGVPTLACQDDVFGQLTITSDWAEAPSPTNRDSPASSVPLPLHQDENVSEKTKGPLRQHTHYRIVVEEVCLPLDCFTNGKQLVSLVLDTLRTHREVATNPRTRLLHRDISSGNVMIFPKIRRDDADGSTSLVWTGILSDWELATSVDGSQASSEDGPVHRLGTYQFMSMNLFQEPSRPVLIADELESFFHVIVYYAVRHLQSTCDRPSSWITDYFYRYSYADRLGLRLATIESHGRLQTVSPPGPLLFFSPLDKLLFIVLQSFKARYKIMQHERQRPHAPTPSPPPPPTAPMTAAQRRIRQRNYPVDEKVRAILDAERAARKLVDEGPTTEERELAAKLVDHTFMIGHLERFLQDPNWSEDDRIPPPPPLPPSHRDAQPDVAPTPNPNPKAAEVGKRPRPAESTNNEDRAAKRQRTSKPKPVRRGPAPARPSTHAMRTRSQTHRERAALGAPVR